MSDKYLIFLNIRNILDEQQVILQSALEIGYKVILLSNISVSQYLYPYIHLHVKRENKYQDIIKQTIQLKNKYDVRAVFSWNDPDVELAADIAKSIGVPSLGKIAAHSSRNKYVMHEKIYDADPDYVAAFCRVLAVSDVLDSDICYPAIIKPISASGSKGIFKVNSKEEAVCAYHELSKLALTDQATYGKYGEKFILEEYIDGNEFSVEGIVVNNIIQIAGITDKLTTNKWHLEYRHIFPANYPKEVSLQIKEATCKIVRTIGLNNCFFHLEGKWNNQGFKFIEVAARTGGDLISTHLLPLSLGINWLSYGMDAIINQRVSKKEKIISDSDRYLGIKFKLASESKLFNGLSIQGGLYNIPGIVMLKEIIRRGEVITLPPKSFTQQRLGYVVVQGNQFSQVEGHLDRAIKELKICVCEIPNIAVIILKVGWGVVGLSYQILLKIAAIRRPISMYILSWVFL